MKYTNEQTNAINKFKRIMPQLKNMQNFRASIADAKHEAIASYLQENEKNDDLKFDDVEEFLIDKLNNYGEGIFYSSYGLSDLYTLMSAFNLEEIETLEEIVKDGYFAEDYEFLKSEGFDEMSHHFSAIFDFFHKSYIYNELEENF